MMEFLGPNDQTPDKRTGLQRLVPPIKRKSKA
jgi:hypothetical protein